MTVNITVKDIRVQIPDEYDDAMDLYQRHALFKDFVEYYLETNNYEVNPYTVPGMLASNRGERFTMEKSNAPFYPPE